MLLKTIKKEKGDTQYTKYVFKEWDLIKKTCVIPSNSCMFFLGYFYFGHIFLSNEKIYISNFDIKYSNDKKSIKFNGKDIIIELKDTFKALQNVKEIEKIDDRNINLRTLEKPSILTKNGSFEPQIVNGAGGGIRTHAYRNHNPRS